MKKWRNLFLIGVCLSLLFGCREYKILTLARRDEGEDAGRIVHPVFERLNSDSTTG